MPCKHLFALLQYGGVTWSDLPQPFREHPLFSLDKKASILLKANSEIGHDLALLSQSLENLMDHPLGAVIMDHDPAVYNEEVLMYNPTQSDVITDSQDTVPPSQSEDGRKFAALRKIRELCRGLTENTYYLEKHVDAAKVEAISDSLSKVYEDFLEGVPDAIPRLSSSDLRYQTLKQLSKSSKTYKGRKLESLAPRRGRRGVKRARGDLKGLEEVNLAILKEQVRHQQSSSQIPNLPRVEENLWPENDIPEDELNTLLDKQYSDIFVPADVKSSLAQGDRIDINTDILGDCIIPDSMHSDLDKRNYHPFPYVHGIT